MSRQQPVQKVSPQQPSRISEFPPRTIGDVQALPRAPRALLLDLWRLAGPEPYVQGQQTIADVLQRSLRTTKRLLTTLERAGFLVELHRFHGRRSALLVHPIAAEAAAIPVRPRNLRTVPSRLPADSMALRCAAVPHWGWRCRALPVPYIVELMTERERAIVAYAAESNGGPICDDLDLSADLIEHFRIIAYHQAVRSAELVRAAANRAAWLKDDVPPLIFDHEDAA